MSRRDHALVAALRTLTVIEVLVLAAAALFMIDRRWAYGVFASAALVIVYVLLDRRLDRRVAGMGAR